MWRMQPRRSLCCLPPLLDFSVPSSLLPNRELLFAIHSAQYSFHAGRSYMSSYCRFENSLHQLSFLVLSLPNRRRCLRISHTHTHRASCAQFQLERQPSSFRIVNDVCKWLYVTYAFTMYYTFCNISWQCRRSLSRLLEKHPEIIHTFRFSVLFFGSVHVHFAAVRAYSLVAFAAVFSPIECNAFLVANKYRM